MKTSAIDAHSDQILNSTMEFADVIQDIHYMEHNVYLIFGTEITQLVIVM